MRNANGVKPHVKERFRAVFLALQQDARRYPGGVPELAEQLGRTYGGFKNALTPTNDAVEPTFETVLEVIETAGGEQTVQAIARLAGMRASRVVHTHEGTPKEVTRAFMHLVREAGKVNERTAEALEDSRLDASERREVGELLEGLAAVVDEMLALVRS